MEKAKWEDEDWLGKNFPRKLSNGYILKILSKGLSKKASQYGLYGQYIVCQDEGTKNLV